MTEFYTTNITNVYNLAFVKQLNWNHSHLRTVISQHDYPILTAHSFVAFSA